MSNIDSVVKTYSREELESKFINLSTKRIKDYSREELESDFIEIFNKKNKEQVDFSVFKTKRKMQFLHKTNFGNKYLYYNYFLNLAIESKDKNLLSYFLKLYKKLYKVDEFEI